MASQKFSASTLMERLDSRMKIMEDLLNCGSITKEVYEEEKKTLLHEELQKMHEEELAKSKASTQAFLPEEIAREPFLKDILSQEDLWRRHEAAIAEDCEAWEKRVRDTYIAKAKAGGLSPLLVLFGQYMMFASDLNAGRRRLLEILFLQAADQRMKIHNWLILGAAPKGTNIAFGRKVEGLSFPLFPFGQPDLEQLNSVILDEPNNHNIQGGNGPSNAITSMYLQDSQVLMGGSIPFPVLDNSGNATGCFVDLQPVHDAFKDLERSVRNKDGKEDTHLSRVKRLLDMEMRSSNLHNNTRYSNSFIGNERWRRSAFPTEQKKPQYGKYRGGMAPEDSKNE